MFLQFYISSKTSSQPRSHLLCHNSHLVSHTGSPIPSFPSPRTCPLGQFRQPSSLLGSGLGFRLRNEDLGRLFQEGSSSLLQFFCIELCPVMHIVCSPLGLSFQAHGLACSLGARQQAGVQAQCPLNCFLP